MSQIDVNTIIESVLTETKSTKSELIEYVNKRIGDSIEEFETRSQEEQDSIPAYVPLIAEAFMFTIDREMEIYKNLEIALQRVIDEMDATRG